MQIAVMDTDGKNFTGNSPPALSLSSIPGIFSQSGKKVLYVKVPAASGRQGRGTPASGYDAWEVDIWKQAKRNPV